MSAASRRAADRERQAAEILDGERVIFRPPFVSAPDVKPIPTPDGHVLIPEVATRDHLPEWVKRKVAQARRYAPGAIPVVVLSEKGGEPLALVPLRDFARLVGIRSPPAGEQLSLLGGNSK